jgi:molybdopterin synthase catalytic subunit
MVIVQTEDFNIQTEYDALRSKTDGGAIVTFTGLVRELYDLAGTNSEAVQSLYLEHYPGMTEKCLQDIADQAANRWNILGSRVIHRVGELKAGDQIVFVGAVSAHRADAFAAAQFIMDYLKSQAPFWKKQTTSTSTDWVESKQSDTESLKRW